MPARSTAPGTSSTTRLRKLACPSCGNVARQSRAAMLRGLLGCPCGDVLVPAALEDAIAAVDAGVMTPEQLEAHPEHDQWLRELSSIAHGQASHVQRGRATQQPEGLAWARILTDRRAAAVQAQRDALKRHGFRADGAPDHEEPIPF